MDLSSALEMAKQHPELAQSHDGLARLNAELTAEFNRVMTQKGQSPAVKAQQTAQQVRQVLHGSCCCHCNLVAVQLGLKHFHGQCPTV